MQFLKYGTGGTIRIGPFLDEDDGKTAETALSIAQADIRLSKNGGDFAQTENTGGATHDENGWYYLTLDINDTGAKGRLTIAIHKSGALPVWQEYMVLDQVSYDAFVSGTDNFVVDLSTGAISNTSVATSGANMIADHVIRRSFQNACDSSYGDTKTFRSLLGAIAKLVNKVAPNGSNLEIFEDDDSTVLGTQAVTSSASAEVITALDTS